jgi:hypothetical protein
MNFKRCINQGNLRVASPSWFPLTFLPFESIYRARRYTPVMLPTVSRMGARLNHSFVSSHDWPDITLVSTLVFGTYVARINSSSSEQLLLISWKPNGNMEF